MAEDAETAHRDTGSQYGAALAGWCLLILGLVLGGLFLASRAADDYTYASGFLFSGFGFLLALRLFNRALP